jgi:hypothetical protein
VKEAIIPFIKLLFLLFPTFIPLSGVGTTYFHDVVIKIRQLFSRPAACLRWVQITANAAETNGLTCLPKHGGDRGNNFDHPSNDWPLRTLLSLGDRTPSVLTAEPSSSSKLIKLLLYTNYNKNII